MKIRLLGFSLLLAPAVGACATATSIESPWAWERHIEVVREFEERPELRQSEQALLEVGLAHAFPDSPVYAPDVARERFATLLTLYPRTAARPVVEHLIPLLETIGHLGEGERARDREIERLHERIARLEARVGRLEIERENEERRSEFYRERAEALQREVNVRELRIRELEETLEGLMKIDLAPGG